MDDPERPLESGALSETNGHRSRVGAHTDEEHADAEHDDTHSSASSRCAADGDGEEGGEEEGGAGSSTTTHVHDLDGPGPGSADDGVDDAARRRLPYRPELRGRRIEVEEGHAWSAEAVKAPARTRALTLSRGGPRVMI